MPPFFVCPTCRQYFGITEYRHAPSGTLCNYCSDFTGRPRYKPAVNIGETIQHLGDRHPYAVLAVFFALVLLGCAVTGS